MQSRKRFTIKLVVFVLACLAVIGATQAFGQEQAPADNPVACQALGCPGNLPDEQGECWNGPAEDSTKPCPFPDEDDGCTPIEGAPLPSHCPQPPGCEHSSNFPAPPGCPPDEPVRVGVCRDGDFIYVLPGEVLPGDNTGVCIDDAISVVKEVPAASQAPAPVVAAPQFTG